MAERPILALENVHLRRGERELYAGLSAEFAAGEICWIQGHNGRGKTTLLRILAGFITPEQGRLSWRGDVYASRLDESQQAISYLDERLGLGRDLSVLQNLAYANSLGTGRDLAELLQSLGLKKLQHRLVRELSTGQKKRVGIARLLLEGSLVWLLDEPGNGLDPQNRKLLANCIDAHAAAGGLCLFASHDALPLQSHVRHLELHA